MNIKSISNDYTLIQSLIQELESYHLELIISSFEVPIAFLKPETEK